MYGYHCCVHVYINYTDTTDVQVVGVNTLDEELHVIVIRCDFITGSSAQGCVVTLVGGYGIENLVVNLTRRGNALCAHSTCTVIVKATYPAACYSEVFAYDLEEDGSVGSLPIPGYIRKLENGHTLDCSSQTNTATSKLQ